MGKVDRPQIQTMLQSIVDGGISFDDYVDALGFDYPSAQLQLKAALEQRRLGKWSHEDYARVRDSIRAEFDLKFQQQQTAVVPAPRIFDPLADEGEIRIPEGLQVTVLPSSMGRAEKSNPVRTKSGAFRPHVAEVWFISPTTGKVKRRMFVAGKNMIAEAFAFANEISDNSARQPSALVKFRRGEMKGNRHVILCTPKGYIVTPQTIVEWCGHNKAVGEKLSKLSLKVLKVMLAQNAEIREAFGTTVDKYGTIKVCMGGNFDIPILEPADPKEVEYSLRFVSGDTRTINIRPRTDRKDEDGNVTLAGHKRRAYELLLDTEGVGADMPRNVRYTFGNKVYDVSRREAIDWSSEDEDEDPGMAALHAAFIDGRMDRDEYEERAGMLAESLAQQAWEDDNPGRTAAQERYRGQLEIAMMTGVISKDAFEYMQNWTHPAYREHRAGPTMWERKTRVEFYANGRMVWQRAKNDNSPGANWVGGQSFHEAQIYNMM